MLGIDSIQQTAHALEDFFKVLKEHRVKVDQKLESLFFQGFDTLQVLLEELQGPFGLTEQIAINATQTVQVVSTELRFHLATLVSRTREGATTDGQWDDSRHSVDEPLTELQEEDALLKTFKDNVPSSLREMLQLFKQADSPAGRQQLQTVLQSLAQVGEQFKLTQWHKLIELARLGILNPKNSYSLLAPVLIKEIKTARDLVLAGRSADITSSQLQALVSSESSPAPEDDFVNQPKLATEVDIQSITYSQPVERNDKALSSDIVGSNQHNSNFEAASEDASEPLFDVETLFTDGSEFDSNANFISLISAEDSELNFGLELLTELEESFVEPGVLAIEPTVADRYSHYESNLSTQPLEPDTLPDSGDVFSELEALLAAEPLGEAQSPAPAVAPQKSPEPEFADLEKLIEDTETVASPTRTKKEDRTARSKSQASRRAIGNFSEQTMRVPVKQLDSLGNLVGELVVDRNSLEQNQERLRQSLDNLLYQAQRLTNVGQQMQDLYERSLLERSLLSVPHSYKISQDNSAIDDHGMVADATRRSTGTDFDALEMDRFTSFHTLSQEVIERIVRLREAASDIEFTVDESDQVARMFRQATTQLQEGLTQLRMVPFSQIAERLPRAVRDLAIKCGKRANLEIEGRETLIDKGILERLYDPMTHLVNNALAHGIEPLDVRQSLGKSLAGQIKIQAFHQGNQTIISVSDDGSGIDPEQVKAKAIEKGLISPNTAGSLSQPEIYNLLFLPGFSTKDQADDLAGRGVGMDVVRTSLDEIHGVISTDSTLGQGTTFTIRLPVTLSIAKALFCIDNYCRIAFPLDGVADVLDITKGSIQFDGEGKPVLQWHDLLIPFRPLSELLTHNRRLSRGILYGGSQDENLISVVVLRGAGKFMAIQVDQTFGEQEIVIKQLQGPVPKPKGLAGVTVLGDGRIMPIADVLELINLATGKLTVGDTLWPDHSATPESAPKTEPLVLIVDDSITVRELLSTTFNKIGYRVEQARDGQEAWEKLCSGLPCDLVFCDIEMPRMDGLELLSRIQNDPLLNHLPIAMLTSRGADRHRQTAIQLGAKGYFTKPYLEEALLDAAQRLLKGEVLAS